VLAMHFLALAPTTGWLMGLAWALALVLQLEGLSAVGDRGVAAWPLEAARWALGAVLLAASPLHGGLWLGLWCAGGLAGALMLHRAARPSNDAVTGTDAAPG